MGHPRNPSEYNIAGLYSDCYGRGALQTLPRAEDGLANAEHAGKAEQAGRIPGRSSISLI